MNRSQRPQHVTLERILQEVMQSQKRLQPEAGTAHRSPRHARQGGTRKAGRVIGHLVQNAIEATPYTGKVSVTLTARMTGQY
jgi:signal transduction histidine kinase